MKTIHVVAAVNHNEDKIFAQSGDMVNLKEAESLRAERLKKETPQQTSIREIKVELEADIEIGAL